MSLAMSTSKARNVEETLLETAVAASNAERELQDRKSLFRKKSHHTRWAPTSCKWSYGDPIDAL